MAQGTELWVTNHLGLSTTHYDLALVIKNAFLSAVIPNSIKRRFRKPGLTVFCPSFFHENNFETFASLTRNKHAGESQIKRSDPITHRDIEMSHETPFKKPEVPHVDGLKHGPSCSMQKFQHLTTAQTAAPYTRLPSRGYLPPPHMKQAEGRNKRKIHRKPDTSL